MIAKIKKDLKNKGYKTPKVKYNRLNTHSISYEVALNEADKSSAWDGHYFVGEEGTGNSKEAMIEDWNSFLNDL